MTGVDGAAPAGASPVGFAPAGPGPLRAAAAEIVDEVATTRWGRISPSVYETGRLVSIAPWLVDHAARVAFLRATQRPDGGWGQPGGYALVPTLSATEALLATARHGDPSAAEPAGQGLDRLIGWLTGPAPLRVADVPDTPAIELIVPAMVDLVNAHLDALTDRPVPGLDRFAGVRLATPPGMDDRPLRAIRAALGAGAPVPDKLLHSLEVVGPLAGEQQVHPPPLGGIGASPAASAAWLAGHPSGPTSATLRYLEAVTGRHGGPVSSVVPIAPFERAWVLSLLIGAGFRLDRPDRLTTALAAPLGPGGLAGGEGLPLDADTTSVTLLTLAQLGAAPPVDSLWPFEVDTHFSTWLGERTPSTTTNAHVLELFGHHAAGPATPARVAGRDRLVVAKLTAWLCAQQLPDGSWTDKWHASPYYATFCCVTALHRYGRPAGGGDGGGPAAAIHRAVRWIVATQGADGSWGRWQGTAEETAYAVQTLLLTALDEPGVHTAAAGGLAYLTETFGQQPDPPLWHDKDLYVPPRIVRAAVLAAFRLAGSDNAMRHGMSSPAVTD
ncbi:prenyltransferase [Dactylosporangium aurantiacum]|uniref:Prenyltransferase n=1 Tax=Dactylosporangium aurantiacum TaxID=35754 RepID=A0A9Q9ILG8_9ACTN|nr:prenyltransferase/squalene oxidase repeat-containing protein [Dactylosporangium aurantiacum]MDG6105634.1 prenyltransferase/squalene oxidase repeat-containing protein [Dactylosporangium aurantiacum]UWZ57033.1 prenyltransferase [Dactylosporangium aurantiacum]